MSIMGSDYSVYIRVVMVLKSEDKLGSRWCCNYHDTVVSSHIAKELWVVIANDDRASY